MPVQFSVASSVNSGGTQNPSQAISIDPGANAGHKAFYVVSFVSLGASPVISGASTATAPVQIGPAQIRAVPAPGFVSASLWSVDCTNADPSAVVTFSAKDSGDNPLSGFWAIGQSVYTDLGSLPVFDAAAGTIAAAGASSVTCPPLTTRAPGEWALYFMGGTCQTNLLSGPAATTQRINITSSVGVPAAEFDSAASVGGSGTPIGGGLFTANGTNVNQAMAAFTVGLAPFGSSFGGQASAVLAAWP